MSLKMFGVMLHTSAQAYFVQLGAVAFFATFHHGAAYMIVALFHASLHAGWLNVILKYIWPCFFSFIGTNIACNQLRNLFARLSGNLKKAPIFRMAFSQLSLREMSLGAVPPTFDNATVRSTEFHRFPKGDCQPFRGVFFKVLPDLTLLLM
jgi:hypothetical protein